MARRARRATAKVDYAKLNGDVSDDDADDFVDGRLLYHAMMDYGGYKQENAVQVLSPQAVNTAWLAGSHLQVPALVHKSHGGLDKLGLELPTAPDSSKPITVERLMCELGLEQEVSTLDVATRSDGPRWMLHQWGQYWTVRRCISVKTHKGKVRKGRKGKRLHVGEDDEAESSRIHPSSKQAEEAERSAGQEHEESEQRGIMGSVQSVGTGPLAKGISNDARRKILEIVALPLIGTAIGNRIPPAFLRGGVPHRPQGWAHAQEMGLAGGLVANVAVSGAYVDFRFARGGAAMWLHVVSGKKAFCCVPPTSMNLAAYVSWLNTEQRNASFFAALAEDAALIEVHAGETLFLPAGWLFAQATIDDAFLLSGTFLHAGALRGVLRVMDVEDCLQMPRLQAQEELLWFTAMHISQELVRYVGRAKHAEVLSRVRAEKALKMKEQVALEALTGAGREPVGVLEDAPGRDRGTGRGTVVQLGRKRARSPGPDAASGKRRPGEAAGASAGGAHGEERERAAEQAGMPRKVVLKVPQQAGPPKSQAAAGAKPARKPQEGGAHTQPGASKAPSLTVKLGDKGKSAAASTPKRASLMVKLGDRKAGPTPKTPSLTVKLGDKAKKGGSLPDGDAGPAPAGAPQAPLTVKLGAGTQSSKPAAGATASTLKPPLTVRLGTAKAEAKPAPPSLKVTLQAAGSPSKQKVKLGATVGDKEQVAADPGDAAAARAAEAVKLEQSASAALSAALAGRKTKVKLQPKGIAQSTKTTVHSPGKATPQTGVKEKDTARNASPQDGLEGEDVPGEATPRVGGKVDACKDATEQADLEGTGAGENPTLPDGMNEEDTPRQDHPPAPSEPTPEAFLKVEETPGKLTPKEGLKEEHAAEETGHHRSMVPSASLLQTRRAALRSAPQQSSHTPVANPPLRLPKLLPSAMNQPPLTVHSHRIPPLDLKWMSRRRERPPGLWRRRLWDSVLDPGMPNKAAAWKLQTRRRINLNPPAGDQPPADSARSPPEREAERPADISSGSAEQHASERCDDNGQPTAEAAAEAPLRPHSPGEDSAVPTATPAPESPNSAVPAAGREGAVGGAAQSESAQDASTQAGEEAGAGAPGEDGAAEREAGDGAAGEAQLRGGGGSGADVAMEDVPGSPGGDRDNSVPEMAADATAAGHHLEGEREGDGGGALPSDGAGLAEGEEVGQPAAEALDGGSHPMQAPSAPVAQQLAGGTAPSGDAPPAPRPAPVKRVDTAKGRPGTQSKPHTAPQGEVLIALGRSRVVSRVPSRPLMAAALEVAQQAGEGGAPRPRPALPAEGGPTARQPQPQPGAAGKQRASAGDGGAAPADVAGRVATPAAPRPPEPAGRPVLAASVGSGREAGGAGDGGAVPATAAGEEQLAAPAAALDRTPSKPKREAFLGDAEAGVRIREVDDSMLGPWPREDVLALLAALKASLRLLPDGVPRQLARPQELLEELEAGLVCVGADVDADADAPDSELRALAESITLDLKAAPLPSALPKWEIYDDAEAIEEACDNSQLAVVGGPRGDGDSAFEIRQKPGLRRSESLTQTAKALRKPGQAGAPGKGAGGAGGSGRPPVGGTQPKKHAPKSVKDRLKKKLRIR
eukprot:jgi/Tetstr1/433184/TSEL_002368.t2